MKLRDIFNNQKSYFKWRLEKVKRLKKRFPQLFDISKKKVLDIGCGAQAPLCSFLSKIKKAKVFAGDIEHSSVVSAKKIAKKAIISKFSAEKLPFKDKYFDIVFLLDVLEHVKDPVKTIKEAKRVTKDKGLIFIEFSPYYAYPTGHHLYALGFPKGFLPFQLLPLSITKYIVLNSTLPIKNLPQHLFNQFKDLNKIGVRQFKKIIQAMKLLTLDERYCIVLPQKEIEINFISKLPILNEIITMSYSGIFKKAEF